MRWVAPFAVMVVLGAPAGAQVPTPELAGRWKYNEARSDRVQDKLPPDPYSGSGATPAQPPGGRGAAPGTAPSAGTPRTTRPSGAGIMGDYGLLTAVRQPPAHLTIIFTLDSVTVTGDTERTLVLRTDGKKVSEEYGPTRIERKARWEDGDLVVEEKVKDGGTLRYTFRHDRVLKRLTVLARYTGPRYPQPIEVRRVYDRILDAAPGPPPSRS